MKVGRTGSDFPIVCVGGSAGGLDAYIRLLKHLPNDMGVAVVIVNHARKFASRLHEILPGFTTMPVELIVDSLRIEPNRVFIIPAQRDLHVLHGDFRLEPISKPRGWPDVITVFLRSLAEHWEGKLIAVIVSGYDGDGAEALRAIKKVGAPRSHSASTQHGGPTCLKAPSPVASLISYSPPRRSQRPSCKLHMPNGSRKAKSAAMRQTCTRA